MTKTNICLFTSHVNDYVIFLLNNNQRFYATINVMCQEQIKFLLKDKNMNIQISCEYRTAERTNDDG